MNMKIIKHFFLAGLLLLAITAKAQNTARDKIINAMNKAADDWNKGDLESYMALYDPSATMMMPAGRAGLDSIRALYVKYYFDGQKPKQELAYENYQVTMLGEKHALLTGSFVLKPNGKLKERKGIFSLVFVRNKNGWKILHDHSG
ncbi:MAG: nuclear transport factor 2 family protein [Chitinophagaceae bacterium]|nr:nuclear transport factor 2 family protein [Chitinophagaceae bacterium]